jgi:hypothetical protein
MNMDGFQQIQGVLMNKIKSTLPANLSLADELADLLQVSSDSAYRRIRCETALTIDEIFLICQHFNISFDSLTSVKSGCVSFSYNEVKTGNDMIRYLVAIKEDMVRISKSPGRQITYTAVDMPIFHYFKFPEYFYFKMFYWLRSVANDPALQSKKFRVSDLSPEIRDLCMQLADLYAIVPSTEVWSDSILASVLKQITFYWQLGLFENREDAFRLIETIKKTLQMVERQAELNMKLSVRGESDNFSHNYQLYQSDIEIGTNYILVSAGNLKSLYSSFHTFNYMVTTSQEFCTLSENWMNNLIKQASLISGVGEKYRFQFFKKMYCQLDELARMVEKD